MLERLDVIKIWHHLGSRLVSVKVMEGGEGRKCVVLHDIQSPYAARSVLHYPKIYYGEDIHCALY